MRWLVHMPIMGPLILISTSCRHEPMPPAQDYARDYLPLTIGHRIVYDLDSIIFDPFTEKTDTVRAVVIEQIKEAFEDASGRPNVRMEREVSVDGNIISTISYALCVDSFTAERVLNNQRNVILIFPPKTGTRWDGNATNAGSRQWYSYSYTDSLRTNIGKTAVRELEVLQRVDTVNFIEKNLSIERYARGVGLTFREERHIVKQITGDSGFHTILRIRDYTTQTE